MADLMKRRGCLKAQLTRFKTFIFNCKRCETLQPEQLAEIQVRMTSISDVYKTYNDLQEQVELVTPDEELERVYEDRDTFESEYYSVVAVVKCMVDTNDIRLTATTTSQSSHTQSNTLSSGVSFKLPTIDLPKFSGKFEEWLEFKGKYESLIHNSDSIAEVQ